MRILVRAIISGFGMALGAALFKKVAKELGLDDKTPAPSPSTGTAVDPATPGDGGEHEPAPAN